MTKDAILGDLMTLIDGLADRQSKPFPEKTRLSKFFNEAIIVIEKFDRDEDLAEVDYKVKTIGTVHGFSMNVKIRSSGYSRATEATISFGAKNKTIVKIGILINGDNWNINEVWFEIDEAIVPVTIIREWAKCMELEIGIEAKPELSEDHV